MINFTTETQSIQRKPKREWTRIDANRGTKRHKTNRGWTQIDADNIWFRLCSLKSNHRRFVDGAHLFL